jgi:hypothetical protein
MIKPIPRIHLASWRALVVGGLLVALPLAAAERTYKWVDEKGQVHYGGTPPPGIKAEQIAGPPPPPTGAKSDGGSSAAKQFESPTQKSSSPSDTNNAKSSTAEMDRANCELAKKNLDILKTQPRISLTDPDGKMRAMPEEERAEQIKKAEEGVKNFCK